MIARTQLFQPKYTMHGFEWKEQRGLEGIGFVRSLRSILTAHLEHFRPILNIAVKQKFDDELGASKNIDGTCLQE